MSEYGECELVVGHNTHHNDEYFVAVDEIETTVPHCGEKQERITKRTFLFWSASEAACDNYRRELAGSVNR